MGVGDTFGWAESLPRKDLTPWEQERAVSPERSWGPSAMTCVEKVGSNAGRAMPMHGSWSAGDIRAAAELNRTSKAASLRSAGWTQGRGPQVAVHCQEDVSEHLSPVKAVNPRYRDALDRRPRVESDLQVVSPGSGPSSPISVCYLKVHPAAASDEDEVRALLEEKRRLQGELSRTQRKLQQAVLLARTTDDVGVALEYRRPLQAYSGNGGGALRATKRTKPSAGGPFAGKQAVMQRSSSAAWSDTVNGTAESAYTYLGPPANGPPLPEIHPLWP